MTRMRRSHERSGFTLVELLIAMAVGLILMAAVYQFFIRQQRSYTTQDEVLRLQERASAAQDIVAKTIQLAGAYSPQTGQTISLRGQVILSASDHYVTVQADDPFRTSDLGVIRSEEVVTFAVSKPLGSRTEWVDDGQSTTRDRVNMYFDQNGNGTVEASENYDVKIPLALGGPPYTLYRITPNAASPATGAPVFEAVAQDVENLVLRYFDQNGAPVPRDAATGAALPPPYVLTGTERALVRSVELDVVFRTSTPDAAYKATVSIPDRTVATYNASGTPRTGITFTDDGYRRRMLRTRATARNLSANTCGSLLLTASPARPGCPDSAAVTATLSDRLGAALANKTVTFTLDPTSGASLSSTSTVTSQDVTTNTSGNAQVTVYYMGTSKSVSVSAAGVIDCSPVGPAKYTLINAIAIDFLPGVSTRVTVTGGTPTEISTCGSPIENEMPFTAFAVDACGNVTVPDPGFEFAAVDKNGNPFGRFEITAGPPATYAPTATLTTSGQQFKVLAPDSPTPFDPALRAPPTTGRTFPLRVVAKAPLPAWVTSTVGLPLTAEVRPWPARRLEGPSQYPSPSPIVGTAHTDCPSASVSDTFWVTDCYGNRILESVSPIGAAATLAKDPAGPSDQGTVQVTPAAGTPWAHTAVYAPPSCKIDPLAGAVKPSYTLELKDGGTVLDTWPSSPLPFQLGIASCATTAFDLTVTPQTMSECESQADIRITGCGLGGAEVELVVTSSGGSSHNASFEPNPASPGFPKDTDRVTLTGSSPSTGTKKLYIGNAEPGDTLTVTAYNPPRPLSAWTRTASPAVTVSKTCAYLKVYADPGYSIPVGNGVGEESRLSQLSALYAELKDCHKQAQYLDSVTFYLVADDGNWLDRITVPLKANPLGTYPPLYYRLNNSSSNPSAVVLRPATAPDLGNYELEYPVGEDFEILAEYYDSVDVSDPYNALFQTLAVPVTLPLAARQCANPPSSAYSCQKAVQVTNDTCPIAYQDDFGDGIVASTWTFADIGSPAPAGSQSESAGNLWLSAGGTDIWGASDQFRFGYRTLTATDDFVVTAKITSLTNTDPWAKAGLMVRQSTAANGMFVDLIATPVSNNHRFQYRTAAGASAQSTGQTYSPTFPHYLRLKKVGTTFTPYFSPDGVTYTQYLNDAGNPASQTVSFTGNILVGLAATSHNTALATTAKFDDFRIECP